ncbi:hypothetical protein [Streptomyces sp. RP5T]|uniref:hypothetical protein n=1 Tax=Streptomyces sp. RP5T TaxID=2490848 RepID=UPI000F64C2D8|nr:hypothetical protein [Streptomyces sp. RP5T]RRR71383.1 hypothetical protein EHS43_39620 [Streptomyces sp. RP5T]
MPMLTPQEKFQMIKGWLEDPQHRTANAYAIEMLNDKISVSRFQLILREADKYAEGLQAQVNRHHKDLPELRKAVDGKLWQQRMPQEYESDEGKRGLIEGFVAQAALRNPNNEPFPTSM